MGDKIFENLDVFKLVRVWAINVYQEFSGKAGRPVGEEKHMELKNCANTCEPSLSLAKNAHQEKVVVCTSHFQKSTYQLGIIICQFVLVVVALVTS